MNFWKKLGALLLVAALLLSGCGKGAGCRHEDTDSNGVCDTCYQSVYVYFDFYSINDLHGKVADADTHPGVDELSTYLQNARQTDQNAIFLSTGDMFQGSPESNSTYGNIVTDWMSEMGFAAMAVGNHDFDWGEEYIKKNAELAEFPFLAINIYEHATGERAPYCAPSTVVEADGLQVGIIGAIGDCYSSIAVDKCDEVYFKVGSELTQLVKDEADRLRKKEGVDLIVYVIHDGHGQSNYGGVQSVSSSTIRSYYDTSLSDGYVDLVFEGHTHQGYRLVDEHGVYHLQNRGDNKGGISHAEVAYNTATGAVEVRSAELVSTTSYAQLEDHTVVQSLLTKYNGQIAPAQKVLGTTERSLSADAIRQLVADMYYEAGMKAWGDKYDIALGGGFISVRSPSYLERGEVTYGDLQMLLPFDNDLVLCSIKGRELSSKFFNNSHYAYFISYGDYGASIKNNIDMSATYYVVTDTYTSDYKSNKLTVVERYTPGVYARDLVAAHIEAGGLGQGSGTARGGPAPVSELDYIPGDVSGDSKVNVRDLGILQQHLNGWTVTLNLTAADVSGDGKVNVRDLGTLQQALNGWDVELLPGGSKEEPEECTQHTDTNSDTICDVCAQSVIVYVDLYGINDLHGKIADGTDHPGVDELTTYLKNARATDDHALFLAAGDMWQGAAESNLTYGTILTDWMNALDFTAMAVGNHDYDWGEQYIEANNAIADFPFLAINIYDRATNARVSYCEPSVMVECGGVQVGIIGAIGDCYSSISSDKTEGVYFKVGSELTSLVRNESIRLREEGADLIVYVLHDGYGKSQSGSVSGSQIDSYYDTALSNGYVDLVFEGHTHQGYRLQDEYGVYHLQNRGDNQGGISHAEVAVNSVTSTATVQVAELISTSVYASLADDPIVAQLMDKYADVLSKAEQVLGNNRYKRNSSTICNKVAQLYYEAGEAAWGDRYNIVLGGGFINTRSPYNLAAGPVKYGDLNDILPFDNQLMLCSIQGRYLLSKFINTNNSDYFIYYGDYGNSVKNNIQKNATYYVVVDSYTAQYSPNRLTVVEEYDPTVFARDLLADFIAAGGWA